MGYVKYKQLAHINAKNMKLQLRQQNTSKIIYSMSNNQLYCTDSWKDVNAWLNGYITMYNINRSNNINKR